MTEPFHKQNMYKTGDILKEIKNLKYVSTENVKSITDKIDNLINEEIKSDLKETVKEKIKENLKTDNEQVFNDNLDI